MTYVGGFVSGYRHDERTRPGGMGLKFLQRLKRLKSKAKLLHSRHIDTNLNNGRGGGGSKSNIVNIP